MAQDIKELFENEKFVGEHMPTNHEERFLKKLNEALPENKVKKLTWFYVAASIVVILGLSIGAFKYNSPNDPALNTIATTADDDTKTLGDVSPNLRKIEDYYLASINLELSKIKPTPETKELFDDYVAQLDKLNKEYKRLSVELTESGPSELTINALIDNLKFRLNLLYRLKEQLKELNTNKSDYGIEPISV